MKREELYREALRNIERRRQAAEMQAMQRQAALYEAEPRLAELAAQKNALGAQAAHLAALGQMGQASQKLTKLREISAERKRLLLQMDLTENDLQPTYSCQLCGDSGRKDGTVCTCVQEEIKRLRRQEINQSGPLSLCRFENFLLERYPEQMQDEDGLVHPRASMQAIVADCRAWAEEFGPHSQSLYMFGYAGLGKTHLALAVAGKVLEAGYDVIYVSAHNAFATIAASREEGAPLFESMLEADLLVLDDLGTEFLNAYVLGKLYELVNTRQHRPTIYTTNICNRKLLDARYDEKITSRLLGNCHLMRFWGKDLRMADALR